MSTQALRQQPGYQISELVLSDMLEQALTAATTFRAWILPEVKTGNRSIIILLVNGSGYGGRGRGFGPARELLTNESDSILLAYSGFREGRAIPLRNRDYELPRYLTIRCIFCGRKLTKHDTIMLSNTDKFSAVLSLQDKVLFRTDRRLSTYIAHAEETQPTLSLGNGWHAVSCFSGTEFKQPRIRTMGILNNKIYWDDFPHSKEDPRGQILKTSWINHLMGIVPAERQPIDAKTRALVLETTDGRCTRCDTAKRIELHHRRPVIHGGTNEPSNLVPLCYKCHFLHSHEYTEHIWPDLARIFVESELPADKVAVPTLGLEFWHAGSKIEGRFDSSRLCKRGKGCGRAYKLALDSPMPLNGELCSIVEIPPLFGFYVAMEDLWLKGYQPRTDDLWKIRCSAMKRAKNNEGFSPSPEFQIRVLRRSIKTAFRSVRLGREPSD